MPENAKADPELTLITEIAAGSREAFEELYHAYQTRVYRYLFHMVGDAGMAEELTNDTMVSAWKGAASFKGQSKPLTWLIAIARNKALNELRRKRPQEVDPETMTDIAAPEAGPEGAALRGSLEQQVRRVLQKLSPDHREVVELTFYQGLKYEEIAEVMQCPLSTVKTRMFYAKQKLRAALEKAGMGEEMP